MASNDQKTELFFKTFNNTVNADQLQIFAAPDNKYPFRDYVLNENIFSNDIPGNIADFSVNYFGTNYYGIAALDLSNSGALGGTPQPLGISYELIGTNLKYYYKVELDFALANNYQTWYLPTDDISSNNSLLRDSIPFNYDAEFKSYFPALYDNLGVFAYGLYDTTVPWLVDYKSGFVQYYTPTNNAAEQIYNLPSPDGTNGKPRYSFVKYIGSKGASGGGGTGGDASFNNIDVSNITVENDVIIKNNLIVNNTISSLDNILLNKLTGNSLTPYTFAGNKLALTFNEMTTGPGFPPDHISLNGDFKVTIKTTASALVPTTIVLKFNAFYSCNFVSGSENYKSRGINIISYTTDTELFPLPPGVNQYRLLDGIELGSIPSVSSLLVMINLDFNSNFFQAPYNISSIEVEFTNNGANGIDNAQFDYWAPNTVFGIGNSSLQDTYTVDLKEVNSITNFTADKINLDGQIKLNGPVEFNGKVTGNIDVRTDIDISGNINFITGDISGVDNIFMSGNGLITGIKDIYIGNDAFVGKDISCAGQVMTNGNNLLYKTSATNWNSEGTISENVKPIADISLSTIDNLTICLDGTFRLYAETRLNNELFTHELIFNSGLNSSSSDNFTQDISGINQALYIDLISSKCNSNQPLFKDLILKSRLVTVSSNTINSSLFVDTNSEVYGNLDIIELQVYNNNRNIPYLTADVPYNRFWNINKNLNNEIVVGFPRISITKGELEKYKYISFMPDISGNNPNIPYPTNSMGALNYDTVKFGNIGYVDYYNMNSFTIEPPAGWYTIAQLGPDFNYNLKQIADGIFYIDTSYFSVDGVTSGQSLIFRAGIYYNNDPYIDIISNNDYTSQQVNQIRIAYDCDNQQGGTTCPTGGALVQIYSTTNSSSPTLKHYLNIKCYENKGNKGWNLNDISYNNPLEGPSDSPICYVDVEGFVNTIEYPDSRRPVLGSTYNQFLYSPLLTNGSNSSNKDMIYNGANVDISGGNLSVSDGNLNVENGNIDFSNSHIILNNTDISSNNLTIQSDNSIVLDVSNSIFTFSENKLDMSRNELYNIDIINANIQDICGSLIIKTNDNNIDASNSTNITLNNIVKLPVVETFDDLSGAFHNFDSDLSNNNNNIIVYNKEIDLLSYRVNQQRNSDFIDPSSNLTDPFLYSNPCIVHLECYLEGWQGGGGGGGVAASGVLPTNNVSNSRQFMPFTTGVTQRGAIGSGISGEFYGYPLINNAFNFIDVPEYGFRTDVDCMVTGMSFQTLKIDSTFNPPSFPGYTNSLFQIVRINPSYDPNPLPSEIILGVEITDPSFSNLSPATKYKIGTILYGPTTTSGVNTGTGTASGEVYFFTNESFVRVPANKRIHPFVGYIKTRNAISSGFDVITMRGSVNGIFYNVNTPTNNNTGYARVKLYIHNYFGQKKEINVVL